MTGKAYPSDVNNLEWGIIEFLLPSSKAIGCHSEVELCESSVEFSLVLREGFTWRALPHDLPPWQTCL